MKYQKTDSPKVLVFPSPKQGSGARKTPIGFLPSTAELDEDEMPPKIEYNFSKKGLHNIEKPKTKTLSNEARNLQIAIQKIIQIWNTTPKVRKMEMPKKGVKSKIFIRAEKNIKTALTGELVFPTYKVGSDKKFRIGHFKTAIENFASTLGNAEYDSGYKSWSGNMSLADFIIHSRPNIDQSKKYDPKWITRKLSPFLFFLENRLETAAEARYGFGSEELFKKVWSYMTKSFFDPDEITWNNNKHFIGKLCSEMERVFKTFRSNLKNTETDHLSLMKLYLDFVFDGNNDEDFGWEYSSYRKDFRPAFYENVQKDFVTYLLNKKYLEDKLYEMEVDGKRWYEMTEKEQKKALLAQAEKWRREEEQRRIQAEKAELEKKEYEREKRIRRSKERLMQMLKDSRPQKYRDHVEEKQVKVLQAEYNILLNKAKELGFLAEAKAHANKVFKELVNSYDSYKVQIKWLKNILAEKE